MLKSICTCRGLLKAKVLPIKFTTQLDVGKSCCCVIKDWNMSCKGNGFELGDHIHVHNFASFCLDVEPL